MYMHEPPLEPPAPTPRQELANAMLASLDDERRRLRELNDEFADVKALLDAAQHLRLDLRATVYANYREKIADVAENVDAISCRLADMGYAP